MAWFQHHPRPQQVSPGATECMQCVVTDFDEVYAFGGNTTSVRFGTLYKLAPGTMKWSLIHEDPSLARTAHSCCLGPENRYIYLFGGWNGVEELSDLRRFDLGTQLNLEILERLNVSFELVFGRQEFSMQKRRSGKYSRHVLKALLNDLLGAISMSHPFSKDDSMCLEGSMAPRG